MQATQVKLNIPDSVDPTEIMGVRDVFLRKIEDSFSSIISVRGNKITIIGNASEANQIVSIFSHLIEMVESGKSPQMSDLHELLVPAEKSDVNFVSSERILTTHLGKPIVPKTPGQKAYIRAIESKTITFGIGPAGTGKTYLAMAMALAALFRNEVNRIVLTRPVVEAGESLGFLPGTLNEKLDPYVRPLYDALFEMCGPERANTLVEQGIIEIAPLAFMRGRTFNESFVILDEAQNTTPTQMKMFLTRLGYNSKFIITGDKTQKDSHGADGIQSAEIALKGINDIAFMHLNNDDIVRHSLVAKIVDAYERADL